MKKDDWKKHPAYLTPKEALGIGLVTNKKFSKWYLLPYENEGGHRSLPLDTLWSDRKFIVYFLSVMYERYAKSNNLNISDCLFMMSDCLDCKCDCPICTGLWKMFDKDHVELKCAHCGARFWRSTAVTQIKSKNQKPLGKYNCYDYCFNCSERLEILDPESSTNIRKKNEKQTG